MEEDSLESLRAAFEQWPSTKRHARQAAPAELMARARLAAGRLGRTAVARATQVGADRLSVDS